MIGIFFFFFFERRDDFAGTVRILIGFIHATVLCVSPPPLVPRRPRLRVARKGRRAT